MRFLISTALQIFLFDADTGQLTPVRAGDDQYFGISWNDHGIILSHSGLDYYSLTPAEYPNSVKGYLGLYSSSPLQSRRMLSAPHQVEAVEDKVLVANTGKNCISVFDSAGSLERDVRLTDVEWDQSPNGPPGQHFNSVHFANNRLWVVAHNFQKPSEVWELSWPEMEVVKVRTTETAWAHNVWVSDAGIILCNSKHGSLYEVESRKTLWQAPEKPILTRGLAVTPGYIAVGRSEYGDRRQRKFSDGGMWLLDRETYKLVDQFVFPGSGCVYDIRAIDVPDDCHNGHPFDPTWVQSVQQFSAIDHLQYQFRKKRLSRKLVSAQRFFRRNLRYTRKLVTGD